MKQDKTLSVEAEFIKKLKEKEFLPTVNFEGDLLIGEDQLPKILKAYLKHKIESITDGDVEDFKDSQPYYGHCNSEYLEGIEEGVKWFKEQLIKKINQ